MRAMGNAGARVLHNALENIALTHQQNSFRGKLLVQLRHLIDWEFCSVKKIK